MQKSKKKIKNLNQNIKKKKKVNERILKKLKKIKLKLQMSIIPKKKESMNQKKIYQIQQKQIIMKIKKN